MIIVLRSPHGLVHGLEAHEGKWCGYDNLAMGFPRGQQQQIIEEVLGALNLQQDPLPHGFTYVKEANET